MSGPPPRSYAGRVEVVAHRMPATRDRCEQLAAAGATMFEVDVQLWQHGIVSSHFLPALGVPGWLEHDNWTLRWHRRSRRDPGLLDTLIAVPPGCRVLLDPKESTASRRAELAGLLADAAADRASFVVSTDELGDLLDAIAGAVTMGVGLVLARWAIAAAPGNAARADPSGRRDPGGDPLVVPSGGDRQTRLR